MSKKIKIKAKCKVSKGLPRWCSGKESNCHCRRCKRLRFSPWVGKILSSRKWQPAPVCLPGKFHGQRSLAGYSPRGCKESDMTEYTGCRSSRSIFKKDQERVFTPYHPASRPTLIIDGIPLQSPEFLWW